MDNEAYLDFIGVTDKKRRQRCLKVMAKYGSHKWWEPDVDPKEYAYYQLKEPIYLSRGKLRFGIGIQTLLNRKVSPYELVTNHDELMREVERAWKYGVGCTSDKERIERNNAASLKTIDYMLTHDIPITVIDLREKRGK